VLGYVLLIVGVALAIIGYVVYLNIRGEKGEEGAESGDEDLEADDQGAASEEDEESGSNGNDDGSEDADMSSSEDDIEEVINDDAESIDSNVEDEEDEEPVMLETDAPELIPAATLLREGVSGRIVIQVGDRQYSEVDALKNSKDWDRIRSLSSDLTDWIEEKSTSDRSKEERESSDIDQTSESRSFDSDSMIVQINEIINKKVQMMDGEEREITLVEGLIGELEVRVGVEKFPIDEVPYNNVRELIQDAVSQWENSQ
jgi:hypothetical protein